MFLSEAKGVRLQRKRQKVTLDCLGLETQKSLDGARGPFFFGMAFPNFFFACCC
jgi:hypothetical protein